MLNHKFFVLSLAIFLGSLNVFPQFLPVVAVKSAPQIFPASELREGMHGTAKTVFRGDRSEEFNVEILGVIPNWIGPKQDMIVGRLSGANAERTFVFAGMSGSPVYIDGKLVGAISYSFPFSKEPICVLTAVAGQPFRAISTPVTFSGLSQKTIDLFAPQLMAAGILPVAGSGGNSAITPMKKATADTLRGGDSVVVHLSRGDILIAAAG